MITETDLQRIESLLAENKRLKEELDDYKVDPAKIFYTQITAVVKALSADMKNIVEGNFDVMPTLIKGDKDDKKFDQVKILLLDAETIFKGLKYGRECIMPELKEEQNKEESEAGMSSVDRIANRNKKK